jgi:hypothetical protein
MQSDAHGIATYGLFYLLRYRYPGGHKWEHRFTTEDEAHNWLRTFVPFVVDYQLTDPSGKVLLECTTPPSGKRDNHENGT